MYVGIDLIEIARIRVSLARYPVRFRERVYTPLEVAECEAKGNPVQSYAGRFAAKEAVGKSLGRGVPFTWTEIEIYGRGKPRVRVSGSMAAAARRLDVTRIDLSMTHSKTDASAVAIAVTDPAVTLSTF